MKDPEHAENILRIRVGDSFAQFRFAEEKEWCAENLCANQFSGLYVDCQSLFQALEELPLHLKLNVAAELVQDATPVTLPQIRMKSNDVPQRSTAPLQPTVEIGRTTSCSSVAADSGSQLPLINKDRLGNSLEASQNSFSESNEIANNLDEDLDLLLKLDAPINSENNNVLEPNYSNTALDVRTLHERNDCLELDKTEESDSASPHQEVTSKNMTEEDLENWLDSMIS